MFRFLSYTVGKTSFITSIFLSLLNKTYSTFKKVSN
jgi:hypothetical protein